MDLIDIDSCNCMIKVYTFDVYSLLDPGASTYFVISYIAMKFDINNEQLLETFSVFTPIGELILAERVYHDCVIFFNHNDTEPNLEDLNMVDFDVILGMDWIHACYASIYCRN